MTLDPRTPVVVGVAAVTQRGDDPALLSPAIDLMRQVTEDAAMDAGDSSLLDRIGWIGVPEGTWTYGDPGRLLAERVGLADVHTLRADVGVTQQELLARACSAVIDGVDVALVVGAEAKHRALRAAIAGVEPSDVADERAPDELLAPKRFPADDIEITRNIVVPTTSYALIETALARTEGLTREAHRRRLADLWGGFAIVAESAAGAWNPSAPSGETIVTPSPDNRMISTPYTKLLCSNWNVDQAAALLVCSVEAATALGIARDRWVFPHSSAVSNHDDYVASRRDLHTSHGARVAGERVLSLAGVEIGDIDIVDLYSCFPAPVQIYARAIGLSLDRQLTLTGGMTFGGGPLNNYVLQAMVAMVSALRASPGALGLSSSVSGSIVKQGWGVWSARPPAALFRHEDVGPEVASLNATCPVDESLSGDVRIASWTVTHDKGEPHRAVAIVESAAGTRSIVATTEPDAVAAMVDGDWIDRTVHASADGTLTLPD